MNSQNQTKDSLLTEIELDEAANVNGGSISGLTETSIFSMYAQQHQFNQYGYSNQAGYGTVIPTKYPGWGWSISWGQWVPLY